MHGNVETLGKHFAQHRRPLAQSGIVRDLRVNIVAPGPDGERSGGWFDGEPVRPFDDVGQSDVMVRNAALVLVEFTVERGASLGRAFDGYFLEILRACGARPSEERDKRCQRSLHLLSDAARALRLPKRPH